MRVQKLAFSPSVPPFSHPQTPYLITARHCTNRQLLAHSLLHQALKQLITSVSTYQQAIAALQYCALSPSAPPLTMSRHVPTHFDSFGQSAQHHIDWRAPAATAAAKPPCRAYATNWRVLSSNSGGCYPAPIAVRPHMLI